MTDRTAGHRADPADDPTFDPGTDHAAFLARVTAWIDDDVDAGDQDELRRLLELVDSPDPRKHDVRVRALTDLQDRFSGPLEFGTAGLRGRMEAGPHRMNRAVVIRAAAGLGAYLLDTLGPAGAGGARARASLSGSTRGTAPARSRWTARAVLTAAGLDVLVLPSALPTPVLAFAVRHLGADAGVMVTASHNPPADNGYKVYLGGRVVTDSGQGAQIVPPYDAHIAAAIAAVGPARSVPRVVRVDRAGPRGRRRLRAVGPRAVRRRTARPQGRHHGAARRGRRDGRARPARRGLHDGRAGRGAARPEPRLPVRRVPQPRGAGRDGPRARRRAGHGGRRRARQRPRRRPVRRRGARPARRDLPGRGDGPVERLAHAARRRGGRAPGRRRRAPCRRVGRPGACSPARSCRHDCWGRSRPRTGSASRRRSRGSSGSRASTASCSATRRRSATASTRPTSGTRTASARRCSSRSSRTASRPRGARSSTRSTTWRAPTACT